MRTRDPLIIIFIQEIMPSISITYGFPLSVLPPPLDSSPHLPKGVRKPCTETQIADTEHPAAKPPKPWKPCLVRVYPIVPWDTDGTLVHKIGRYSAIRHHTSNKISYCLSKNCYVVAYTGNGRYPTFNAMVVGSNPTRPIIHSPYLLPYQTNPILSGAVATVIFVRMRRQRKRIVRDLQSC